MAQELASAGVALRYHRHSGRGEVDFIGEALQGKVLPIEVKSGKTYKRHVALNNLLSVEEFGIEKAFVVSEANVSTELRAGKPVHYILTVELGSNLKSIKFAGSMPGITSFISTFARSVSPLFFTEST